MTNFKYTKLHSCSNNKLLFRQELNDILKTLDNENRFDFLAYCYKHYSDKFPDVLMEVFYPAKEDEKQNVKSSVLSKPK